LSQFTLDTHRMFQIKPSMVKYKPVNVKTILEDIWKYTSTAIDLAFYTYFAKEKELATRILELDKHITENIAQFILHNSMAYGRTRKGAYANLLAFYYGSAMDGISDSVKDIVYTLLVGYAPRLSYNQVLLYAEGEVVGRFNNLEDFKVVDLTDEYPVDILLVVERDNYVFNPGLDYTVKKNSTVYVRGFKEVVLRLLEDKGVEYEVEDIEAPKLEQVIKNLVDIKDCSILILDLAHYILMEQNKELMDEVEDLEVHMDWIHMETLNKLNELIGEVDSGTFMGLISMIKELEDIADAGASISRIIGLQEEFPEEYKELFKHVFESTAERVKTITISKPIILSNFEHFLRKYGGHVLAVKTSDGWIAYPLARNLSLNPGDKLILVYQEEFKDEVEKLIREKT